MAESLTLATLAGTNFSLINEAGGIVLVEHAYPAPSPEPFYASSADTEGERFLSTRYRNRSISIVCEVFGATSETVLANLQAHVAQIGREGGTLTWVTPGGTTVIFDLVTWTGYEPGFDVAFSVAGTSRVSMEFTAKPFARGAEEVAYTQTTNLVTNPAFTVDTTGWTNTGLASMARAAAPSGLPTGGAWSLRCQGNGANDNAYITVAVTNGVTYTFSVYVYLDSSTATNVTLYALSDALAIMGSEALTTTDAWTRLDVTFTATSTASYYLAVQQTGAGNTDYYLASVQAEAASAASDYFDGGSGGCAWTGTANASTSERYAFGVSGVVSAKTFSEATRPVIEVPVTAVPGDVPALGKLEVVEADAEDQAWVIWGQQQRYYADNGSSAALFIKAEDLTTQGGSTKTAGATGAYGATVVRNTDLTTSFVSVVSGQLSASSTYLSHIGTFRVFARCYCPTGNTGTVEVALEWSEGDFLRVTRNATVEYESAWEGSFRLLDLGYVSLTEVDTGTQRWEPRVIARSTVVGDELDVDWLMFVPVDEGSGEVSSIIQTSAPSTFSARDEFNQAAGALTGKTLPTGGTWTGAGDADDFSIVIGARVSRDVTNDAASTGRYVYPSTPSLSLAAVQCDVTGTSANSLNEYIRGGVFARYVDTSNVLRADLYSLTGSGAVATYTFEVSKVVAGTRTVLASTTVTQENTSMLLVVTAYGAWRASYGGYVLTGSDDVLATGGTLASGRVGIYDENGSAGTFYYDNFAAWVPPADAAVFASQSLTVHHDKVRREDSGGTLSVKPSSYEGDYLLVPPTGPDSRTNRFIVKASRNVPGEGADSATDDISARLTVTPRFLVVPS